jgi:hypothetical protein
LLCLGFMVSVTAQRQYPRALSPACKDFNVRTYIVSVGVTDGSQDAMRLMFGV